MNGISYLLIVYLTSVCDGKIKFLENMAPCSTFSADMLRLYSNYFRLAKSLNVKLFLDPKHGDDIEAIADSYLQKLQAKFALKVQRYYLGNNSKKSIKTVKNSHKIPVINKGTDIKHSIKCKTEIDDITKTSMDGFEATFIIAWNQTTFLNILRTNSWDIVKKPRIPHGVILISRKCILSDSKYVFSTLWEHNDILNVIFQAPCSHNPNKIYKFDPFGENATGVILAIDIQAALENNCLILTSLHNLNGYHLAVSLFERSPTAIPPPEYLKFDPIYDYLGDVGLIGMDASVLDVLSQRLNFKPVVDDSDMVYGEKLANGTFTGALAKVANRKVHFSGNGRFLELIDTNRIEFTRSVSYEKMCVVVPKSKRIPQWMIMFVSFPKLFWWLMTIIAIICATYRYLCAKADKSAQKYASKAWLEIFSIFIGFPMKLSPYRTGRIVLAICLTSNIILMGIFQANLFKSFSIISYFKDIDTLEDLDKSGLRISTPSPVFNEKESELMKRLSDKIITTPLYNISTMKYVAYTRNIAGVERKRDAEIFLAQYVDSYGEPLLHIVQECPTTNIIAYIAPRGSPFLPRIDSVLMKFVEAGFIEKWYYDVADGIIMEQKLRTRKYQEIQRPFKLRDLQVAFYILGMGLLVSFVIFLCERAIVGYYKTE